MVDLATVVLIVVILYFLLGREKFSELMDQIRISVVNLLNKTRGRQEEPEMKTAIPMSIKKSSRSSSNTGGSKSRKH